MSVLDPSYRPDAAADLAQPPTPTGTDMLLALSIMVALFLLALLGVSAAAAVFPEQLRSLIDPDDPWGLLIQLIMTNVMLAMGVGAVALRRGWRVFRLAPLSPAAVAGFALLGAAAGLGLAALLQVASDQTGIPLHGQHEQLLAVEALPLPGLALFALVAGGTTPLLEEFIFRGLLFGWLRSRLGLLWGAILSSAVFGALHWPSGQAVWAGLVGLLLAIIVARKGSLWASVAAHAGVNSIGLILLMTL